MKTDKIIIVGGGSAGWMSAATLINQFPDKDITLIESPNIETIGVGENTLAGINNWRMLLGIKDEDFMPHCDATYKVSLRFENFYKLGDGGFHFPFGAVFEEGLIAGKNDWYFKKILDSNVPLGDYATFVYDTMAMVNTNTLTKDNEVLPVFDFERNAAYHFDAVQFGLWLRDHYCIPRGVKHIQEEIDKIDLDGDGYITTLNDKHTADLFIDCSGFKSLLLGKTLKEPFEDYSHIIPNNSAWAVRIPYKDIEKQMVNFSNAEALQNGWVWTIPTWSRLGVGYVYSDKYISDDNALEEFRNYLRFKGLNFQAPIEELSAYAESDDIRRMAPSQVSEKFAGKPTEFKHIKFGHIGIHKRLFVNNVCAIGLAAGFIEPLEAQGLFGVHEFLIKLVKVLQRETVTQWDRDVFNVMCKEGFDNFTEFVALHYALSHRDDSEYWRDITKKSFYDNRILKKIDNPVHTSNIFENIMKQKMEDNRYQLQGGIHTIATGMGWFPTDEITMASATAMDIKDVRQQIENRFSNSVRVRDDLVNFWTTSMKKELTTYQFMKEHIYDSV